MPRLSIRVKTELVRQDLQNLFAEVPKIGKFKIRNMVNRVLQRMRAPGKKINYPVKWDSDKQRRAFFATNGFGGGIPSRRSGKYQRGWKVKQLGETGYMLENRARSNGKEYGKYVGGGANGSGQSRIHEGRWVRLRDATDKEIEKLPKEIRDEIVMVARKKGFKSK